MSQFQSGEPFVELFYKGESEFEKNAALLKGKDAVIVQSSGIPVSENSQHLLMMVDTLKSYGVKHVTAVMPFAPFMRQDRPRQRVVASHHAQGMPSTNRIAVVNTARRSVTPSACQSTAHSLGSTKP